MFTLQIKGVGAKRYANSAMRHRFQTLGSAVRAGMSYGDRVEVRIKGPNNKVIWQLRENPQADQALADQFTKPTKPIKIGEPPRFWPNCCTYHEHGGDKSESCGGDYPR